MRIRLNAARASLGQKSIELAAWLNAVRTIEMVVTDEIGTRLAAMGIAEITDPAQELDPE